MIFANCLTENEEWDKLADATVEAIRAALEKTEREGKNKHGIWMDSEGEIVCKTQTQAEGIADFLEDLGFEDVRTGYYDPEEDKRDNVLDEYTDKWYVDWE